MALKIDQDHARFRDIVRGKIRENLKRYISHGELIGRQGKDTVSIPVPQIDIPQFRFGEKQAGGVGQGDGDPGDPVGGQAEKDGDGSGKAGKDSADHALEVEVTLDELAAILGEELALPRIEPRGQARVVADKEKYTGIRRVGPESLRHFRRTYREALKRQISAGLYNPLNPVVVPVREDKRFRSWNISTEPVANAVIVYMMDVSGCSTAGHLVEMADGGCKGVEEIRVGDRVACVDIERQHKTTSVVTETFRYRVRQTLQIETDDHVALRVTPEHRYFVYNEGRDSLIEKRARDLRPGDHLVLVNRHGDGATFTGEAISEREAYLVGAMLGDGHVYHDDAHYSRYLCITDKSLRRLEHYRDVFREEYGVEGIIKEAGADPNTRTRLNVNSVALVRRFEERYPMLLRRSPSRRIDAALFLQRPAVRAAFLRGLFDAEGTVGGHAVQLFSSSPLLVKEVKLLLSFWGIRARIARKTQADRSIRGARLAGGAPIFHLSVNAKDAPLFAEFVRFDCPEKLSKLRDLVLDQSLKIDAMRSRFIAKTPLRAELEGLSAHTKIRSRLYEKGRNAFSRSNLACMLMEATPDQARTIRETLDRRFLVCTVRSVLWLEEPVDVYDFTVDTHNNYIVDGVLSHNSMGDEQKEIVRIESFWLDTWLRSQYKGLESVYVIHDAVAREVDRETFFHTRESGGTMISSAYKLCAEIIQKRYPAQEWNVYPFHFSDGDNWSVDDTLACIEILKSRVLPSANMFCYGQVESPYGSGQFIKDLREHLGKDERVITSEIRDKDAIMDSIKAFLGKGR